MSTTPARRAHPSQHATIEDALALDTHEVPEIVRRSGIKDIGPMEIPTSWYLDRAIHDLEVERIWKKTWQVVCREDELAEVGDTFVYDIAHMSFVLVRSSKAQIKGFYNACLHRGTTLRQCAGRVTQLQCPFHGFTWDLEGKLRFVPLAHDLPQVNREHFKLPEVQVGRWGGWLFINPDLKAESLESYLGDFPSHFARYPYDRRVMVVHAAKVFNCNWKVLQESFMESWHVVTTHPQQARAYGERGHTVDVFGNYSRGILLGCTTSDLIRDTPTPQEVYQEALGHWEDVPGPILPAGLSPREALANNARKFFRPMWGDLLDTISDSEIVDNMYYTVFPNFHPFGSIRGLTYRTRPYGDDHTRSVLDLMTFVPEPSGERPAPPKVRWLSDEEDFSVIPELGPFGPFVSQDIANLAGISKGLRNNQRGRVVFAKYQELKIRHFYYLWQKALGLDAESSL